jgi:hypothetical protein
MDFSQKRSSVWQTSFPIFGSLQPCTSFYISLLTPQVVEESTATSGEKSGDMRDRKMCRCSLFQDFDAEIPTTTDDYSPQHAITSIVARR